MVMRVMGMVLTICAIAIVGSLTSSRFATPANDPFAPYVDLMSGHGTLEALRSHHFACEAALSAHDLNCSVEFVHHVFSSIHVTLVNSLPIGISFDVNGSGLRVGDLVGLWGMPQIRPQKGGVNLLWVESRVVAGIPTLMHNHLDYYAPIYFVSFTFE